MAPVESDTAPSNVAVIACEYAQAADTRNKASRLRNISASFKPRLFKLTKCSSRFGWEG